MSAYRKLTEHIQAKDASGNLRLILGRIQTRSATPVDSVNEGGVLRAVDQQFSVHSQR